MKTLLLYIFCCLATVLQGQVHFGSGELNEKVHAPEAKEVMTLRGLIIIFILPESQLHLREAYEKSAEENWTWSRFKVISSNEVKTLSSGRYATLFPTITSAPHSIPIYSLSLQYNLPKGNGAKTEIIKLASVLLAHESDPQDLDEYDDKFPLEEISTIDSWHKGRYLNVSPGWLGLYLRDIENQLQAGEVYSGIEERYNTDLLKGLQNDTLYIPSVAMSSSAFTGKKSIAKKAKSILEEYPLPWKMISKEKTESILIEGPSGYLFTRFKIGERGIYQIYDLQENKIVYSKSLSFYSNLKKKHLAEIAELVGGVKK